MPLVLDLLRHGVALPAAQGGDEARCLSPSGRRALERLAAHLAGRGWRPDRAFSSPLARARESAHIALVPTAPRLDVELMNALRPGGEPARVMEALADGRAGQGHVLLVGHQPQLGELAAYLTAGPRPGLAPGCLVRIEFAGAPGAGRGALRWHVRPEDCI